MTRAGSGGTACVHGASQTRAGLARSRARPEACLPCKTPSGRSELPRRRDAMCRAQAAETRRVARRILRSLIRTFKFKSRLRRAFSKLLFSVPALPPDARGPASGSRRPSRCSSPAPFPVTSAARAPEPLPRLMLRRRPTGPIPLCAQVLLQVPARCIGFPGGRGQRPFSLCSFAAPRGARCRLPHSASVCLSGRLRVSGLGPRPLAALRSAVSSAPGAVFAA